MLLDFASAALQAYGAHRSAKENAKQRNLDRALAQGQFDAQMDQTIQRRIADAKKAGIHPLFAMGASSGASPTMRAGGEPTGSAAGDALSSLGQSLALKAMNEANVRAANASATRDEAEAGLINSQKKRLEGEAISRGHDGVKTFPYGTNPGPDIQFGPAEFYNPQVPTSKRTGVRSGTQPGIVEVQLPDGRKVELYDPDLGLDEIGQLKYAYERAIHAGTDAMVAVRNWIGRNAGPNHRARYFKKHGAQGIPK